MSAGIKGKEDVQEGADLTVYPAEMVDWRYAMCPLETNADRFGPFRDLVVLWKERTGPGRLLPRRGDFEAADFRHWMGRIFIARVERAPFNLRFTLWGTQLTEWWQVDYTNKYLGSQSRNPDLWKSSEMRYFEKMDRTPFFGVASGKLTQHGRDHIKVLAVDLPMFEEGGISHVLSAHKQISPGEDIETVMPDCPFTIMQ